uniref:Mitochondrial ATP synthase 6 kDa subunit n=2 Tax=Solanum subgen. Lycopersicon TaxID=49274 RepID=K4C6I9_SOLLC
RVAVIHTISRKIQPNQRDNTQALILEMRKFDPWPIFFRREWSRNWPFLVGFAVTGTIITKMSLGFTEEDAKNSPFVQKHKK